MTEQMRLKQHDPTDFNTIIFAKELILKYNYKTYHNKWKFITHNLNIKLQS